MDGNYGIFLALVHLMPDTPSVTPSPTAQTGLYFDAASFQPSPLFFGPWIFQLLSCRARPSTLLVIFLRICSDLGSPVTCEAWFPLLPSPGPQARMLPTSQSQTLPQGWLCLSASPLLVSECLYSIFAIAQCFGFCLCLSLSCPSLLLGLCVGAVSLYYYCGQ